MKQKRCHEFRHDATRFDEFDYKRNFIGNPGNQGIFLFSDLNEQKNLNSVQAWPIYVLKEAKNFTGVVAYIARVLLKNLEHVFYLTLPKYEQNTRCKNIVWSVKLNVLIAFP